MKIYVSHPSSFDYENELYMPLRQALGKDHEIFYPHDAANVSVKAKDTIAASDVVLAEVTYPSTGQGIELGWADGGNVPVICLYHEGATVSSSLRFVTSSILGYSDADDLINQISSELSKLV